MGFLSMTEHQCRVEGCSTKLFLDLLPLHSLHVVQGSGEQPPPNDVSYWTTTLRLPKPATSRCELMEVTMYGPPDDDVCAS